eukprot:c22534_g1_i1 orf=471-1232(-)
MAAARVSISMVCLGMFPPPLSRLAIMGEAVHFLGSRIDIPKTQVPFTEIGLRIRSEKADFSQLLGGRGWPGGEEGVKLLEGQNILILGESASAVDRDKPSPDREEGEEPDASDAYIDLGSFDKEMMGLTGGFPGGEKGVMKFVSENPPPQEDKFPGELAKLKEQLPKPGVKPRAPPLPLFMPGMTVIVKNPQHPFYMYSGIVQRVTDGRVGVLFEGGNWDKLLTFDLEDLARTSKGPPMSNPKSAVLEEKIVP